MTDHIGEATEKVIDQDALEKLAESLGTLDSDERDWPLVRIHGRMFHVENAAKAASDGLTALIAELKEARRLLQGFIDDEGDAVTNPLGGLSLGGLIDARDNSGCVYQSAALADRIAQTRAFLARNGKGEG